MKTIQNVEIWKIAIGVCLGVFAAQAIPAMVSEIYYAAHPCERPNLSQTEEISCSLSQLLARQKQSNKEFNERIKAEKEADDRFAKEHPEEWKAKKAKEEQEYQSRVKAEQDRVAAIEERFKADEQIRKDKEAEQAAHAKEWAAERAAYEKSQEQLEQQTRALEQQSQQTMQEASNYTERNRIAPTTTTTSADTAPAP